MNSHSCTVIFCSSIPSNETIQLLQTHFGEVYSSSDLDLCLLQINRSPPNTTFLLSELDLSISTTEHIQFIKDTVHKISVPFIVCSSDDNAQFMMECLAAGATDYVLLPLTINVIKTLFLTLHRHSHIPSLDTSGTFSSDHSTLSPISLNSPDNNVHSRIRELQLKNINLTKSFMDNCIPSSLWTPCPIITADKKAMLSEKVSSWHFNPLSMTNDDLIHCGVIILSQSSCRLTEDKLCRFVTDLSQHYNEHNSYHSFTHAIDVMQCIYYFLCQLGLIPYANGTPFYRTTHSRLTNRDIFALLIAAIGHDIAHPGVNNSFLVNSSSPLALLYNDQSVLESFHAMTLFQLLKKHEFDTILGGAGSIEYKEFRKLVISTILSTDMAFHGDYVHKLNEQKHLKWDSRLDLEEKLLFCSGMIKCADISNVARPFSLAYQWSQVLIDEFVAQGDLERELGMQVSPVNDRTKIDLEDSQINFIECVALGLFKSMGEHMQGLSFTLEQMQVNLSIWKQRKEKKGGAQESPATTVVESKSRENDYFKQAAKTLNDDHSPKLPRMPDIALTHYRGCYANPIAQNDQWESYPPTTPVNCQCIIQ